MNLSSNRLAPLTQAPRGYIQPQLLKELWFHTGTVCNLKCPFCFEGSKPGDDRLNKITLEDIKPFIDEAVELGVEKFSFTGGEPFVIRDMIPILEYALALRPCLVLTNGTKPLRARLDDIALLRKKPHSLNFRVSLDFPDPQRHDEGRGEGNFELSLSILGKLYALGFGVSVARRRLPDENTEETDRAYQPFFKKANLPLDVRIVSFPDLLFPGAGRQVPCITESCMTKYHSEETRARFMCCFSKMVIKRNGKMRVCACTLVDDDEDYDLGSSLKETKDTRIILKHHRCYSCFSAGASCSED